MRDWLAGLVQKDWPVLMTAKQGFFGGLALAALLAAGATFWAVNYHYADRIAALNERIDGLNERLQTKLPGEKIVQVPAPSKPQTSLKNTDIQNIHTKAPLVNDCNNIDRLKMNHVYNYTDIPLINCTAVPKR